MVINVNMYLCKYVFTYLCIYINTQIIKNNRKKAEKNKKQAIFSLICGILRIHIKKKGYYFE